MKQKKENNKDIGNHADYAKRKVMRGTGLTAEKWGQVSTVIKYDIRTFNSNNIQQTIENNEKK